MEFSKLCEYFERLEGTASRLSMTEILAELFEEVSVEEIGIVVNLSLGQLRPKFDRLEFNLAEKMVLRAIGEANGIAPDLVKKEYKRLGDIGEVAIVAKVGEVESGGELGLFAGTNQKQEIDTSIEGVYRLMVKIAEDGGAGSQERKVEGLVNLLSGLEGVGAKYVARMVVGKLRLGFSDMTILDALSWMKTSDKSARKELELAYQFSPNIGKIARLVKENPVAEVVTKTTIELGVPVIPALAQRLKTADEMVKKMGKVSVEPKYDGTRVQIHYRGFGQNQKSKVKSKKYGASGGSLDKLDWTVKTFTRNLDETTHMFPELLKIADHLKAEELILDSEAIGYDPETGELKPFQETIQRKRKHGIEEASKEIPLKFFVFDVLYKDGKSLIAEPFSERRRVLEESVVNGELFEVPEVLVTDKPEEIRKAHAGYLAEGLEGAMVKRWDGVYEPGRRGWSWVKFKEVEGSKAKLNDTVDAMVLGLYGGRGKRTAFGVGAFLIGIRADEKIQNAKVKMPNDGASGGFVEGKFYTLSKVGTGLTDQQWRELKERSGEFEVESKPKEYEVNKDLNPDVWLTPGLVVEIAADEITKSPMHSAGVALRFPRLVRFRDDKNEDGVTSIAELKSII